MPTIDSLTMPDPLVLVRTRLLEVPEVVDEVVARIMSRTGDPLPTRPFVRLDLAGGRPVVDERLDRARIQVHVFGDSETEPATLATAQVVRAALVNTRAWVHSSTGAVITGCRIESGPAVLYDDTHAPALVDVTFAVSVYTHP